jgi:hypothetical protein
VVDGAIDGTCRKVKEFYRMGEQEGKGVRGSCVWWAMEGLHL